MDLIEEKIQLIAKEIGEANASPWTITKIIKELKKNNESETKLRKRALKLLKLLDPIAGKIYETFSQMKVYTSKETIENFNRGHIIQSLLKETTISRNIAQKITLEVENEIKDSNIDFLTTAIIRELVNTKLILYGFEKIRNQYARIGLPIYETKKKLNLGAYSGSELREYNLNILPKKIKNLQYNGTIYIEDISGLSHKPFAYSFLAQKYENLEKTILKNFKTLIKNKNYFSQFPNLHGLGFICASFLKSEKQTKQVANKIKNYINLIENDFSNYLELYTPSYLDEYSKFRLMAAKISNELIENKNSVFGVDSKYSLKLLNVKNKKFQILNNSNSELIPLNQNIFSTSKGIDLFVNINLEVLQKDETKFFNELRQIGELIEKLKIQKKDLLMQKKYLKSFQIEEMKTGIGLTNLFCIGNELTGKQKEFANKAIREIKKIFPDDLIFGLGSKAAKDKFSGTVGKEVYSHSILNFEQCLDSRKSCFSGTTKTIKETNKLIETGIKKINYNSF